MGTKLQKLYLTNCNLLTAQDLWQTHYQILLIIVLKKFIKLTINMDMKGAELNTIIVRVALNT